MRRLPKTLSRQENDACQRSAVPHPPEPCRDSLFESLCALRAATPLVAALCGTNELCRHSVPLRRRLARDLQRAVHGRRHGALSPCARSGRGELPAVHIVLNNLEGVVRGLTNLLNLGNSRRAFLECPRSVVERVYHTMHRCADMCAPLRRRATTILRLLSSSSDSGAGNVTNDAIASVRGRVNASRSLARARARALSLFVTACGS